MAVSVTESQYWWFQSDYTQLKTWLNNILNAYTLDLYITDIKSVPLVDRNEHAVFAV